MKQDKLLVVIIPAFNEERTIGQVIDGIPRIAGVKIKVVVVNDNSSDSTSMVAKAQGAIVIDHNVRKGVGWAFRTGISKALKLGADMIVNMDADGQFNPADISRLIRPIVEKDYDFVTCTRFRGHMKGRMPLIKQIGNKIFTMLISFLIKKRFTDTQCGFRAYSRHAALSLTVYGNYTYTQEVFIDLACKGLKMTEVPCRVLAKRKNGRSRVLANGVPTYILRSMKIVIRSFRDYKPLFFFGAPGVFSSLFGLLVGLGAVIFWILNGQTTPVRIYVFISIFFTIAGLILITLSLVADMFVRVRKNQEEILYYIRQRL